MYRHYHIHQCSFVFFFNKNIQYNKISIICTRSVSTHYLCHTSTLPFHVKRIPARADSSRRHQTGTDANPSAWPRSVRRHFRTFAPHVRLVERRRLCASVRPPCVGALHGRLREPRARAAAARRVERLRRELHRDVRRTLVLRIHHRRQEVAERCSRTQSISTRIQLSIHAHDLSKHKFASNFVMTHIRIIM